MSNDLGIQLEVAHNEIRRLRGAIDAKENLVQSLRERNTELLEENRKLKKSVECQVDNVDPYYANKQ